VNRAHGNSDQPCTKPRRGRPPKPLDPDASRAAWLGAELRALRTAHDLTLQALSARIAYSSQHISEVERGRATATEAFVQACDAELGADGALVRLLPAVILECARHRSSRSAARRGADMNGDREDDGRGLAAAPAAAHEVDPALPDHWERLLAILGAHDAARGPREALGVARRELRVIAEHREVARGKLRVTLMGVEARWAVFAGWLCEDAGDRRGRAALVERALCLARESDHPDLVAWARARQAEWSEALRAARLAEAGLRTPRAGAHTRALCAVRAAHAHAQIGDAEAVERMLVEAHKFAAQDSPAPPLAASLAVAEHVVRRWEARCWAALEPVTGVALYDEVLRAWPRGWRRDGGLYVARLARACADAGEPERARAEGRKALAVARATNSSVAVRELTRLTTALRA
jgi:transcriptional regulator with XRE-family HTH domain